MEPAIIAFGVNIIFHEAKLRGMHPIEITLHP